METQNSQSAGERVQELEAQLGAGLEQARENLDQLNRRVTNFIRENPGTCLLGALAIGFGVGKIVSRR